MNANNPFGIPTDLQQMTAQAMGQVNSAMSSYMQLLQGGGAGLPGFGGTELTGKAMKYAVNNLSTTFAFMQGLAGAKDVGDILKMQTEFVQTQMQTVTEQVTDLTDTAIKALTGGAKAGS